MIILGYGVLGNNVGWLFGLFKSWAEYWEVQQVGLGNTWLCFGVAYFV